MSSSFLQGLEMKIEEFWLKRVHFEKWDEEKDDTVQVLYV